MTSIYFATDFAAEEVHKWEIDNDIKIDLVMIPEWGEGGLFSSKEIQENILSHLFLIYLINSPKSGYNYYEL